MSSLHKTYPSLLKAHPQLIHQDQLQRSYVEEWKKFAETQLKLGTLRILRTKDKWSLYHVTKKGRGAFFVSEDRKTVDYLYGYRTLKLKGKNQAYEALAYKFNPMVGGIAKEIFFNFMLPELKFIVTDSIYTPKGHDVFQNQYAYAFQHPNKYNVYSIDTKSGGVDRVLKEDFYSLTPEKWGEEDPFANYRFAIELKG